MITYEPNGPGMADGKCWTVRGPGTDARFTTEHEAIAYAWQAPSPDDYWISNQFKGQGEPPDFDFGEVGES